MASIFTYKYGEKDSDVVQWEILPEDIQITEDVMEKRARDENDLTEDAPNPLIKSPFKKDIPWNPDKSKMDYNNIFFEHFFPDVAGLAEKMDRFLGDVRCGFHDTVCHDGIKFHRPYEDDPDCLVSNLS